MRFKNVASDSASFLLPKTTNHDSATAAFTGRSLAGCIRPKASGLLIGYALAVAGSFYFLGRRSER